MDDITYLRRITDINRQIPLYQKEAIYYILQLQKEEVSLSQVSIFAQQKYDCDDNEKLLRFMAMIMKLSCCRPRYVKELVHDVDGALIKTDGFELLKECLTDYDDKTHIFTLRMRAVLVSLDSKLKENGHDKKFLDYICVQLPISHEEFKTNFLLYKHLENLQIIGPNNLVFIEKTLRSDAELTLTLDHYVGKV